MSLTTGIVSYWKLDESSGNAADSVGSHTLTNVGTTTFAPALIDNGADFGTANTTKQFTVGSNLGITGTPVSISAWIKMRTEISANNNGFITLQDAGTNVGYFITYDYNGGTRRINFNRQQQNISNNVVSITGALGTSAWHHLVLTYDGTTLKTYKDGTAGGTIAASGNGGASAYVDRFYINDSTGQYAAAGISLSSYVDEVGIWSRALSSTEVTQLYNSGAGLQYPFGIGATANPAFLLKMI